MRRQSTDPGSEAARRRLEVLRRELDAAGVVPAGRPAGPAPEQSPEPIRARAPEPAPGPPAAPEPAGRHARRRAGTEERLTGWIEDRLPAMLRGRVRLGMREVGLLVVVGAGGLVVAAVLVLRSGSGATVELGPAEPLLTPADAMSRPASGPASGHASGPVSSSTSGPSASGAPSETATVVVDVSGRVREPGVVTLPEGSRVVDAVRRAGGATHRRDLESLNLARVLTDGEQIVVGPGGRPARAPGGTAPAATAAAGPLIDLNAATAEQLESLPGVGPVTAARILAWRTAHGTFSSLDELLEVDGIGPTTLAELTPHLTL